MSCYFKHQQETTITIPSNVDVNGEFFTQLPFIHIDKCFKLKNVSIINENFISIVGTTYYNIQVSIGTVNWTVRHRYKEFVELHSKLVNGQSIGRDLLPPKKVNIARFP